MSCTLPCSYINGCSSGITCIDEFSSQCTSCYGGMYLNDQISPTPDTCEVCPQIDHCSQLIDCTSTTDVQCPKCDPGYYILKISGQPDTCEVCNNCPAGTYENPTLALCDGTESLPSNQCADCCGEGFEDPDGTCSMCSACPPSCRRCTAGTCTLCDAGYYISGGICQACPPSTCGTGYYNTGCDGTSPVTMSCIPCPDCAVGEYIKACTGGYVDDHSCVGKHTYGKLT